jgi:glycosyltransferase involved in cell wall biosynthesis
MNVLAKLKKLRGEYDIVNSHTRFFDNSWWAPLVAKYMGAASLLTDHCASHPVHHNPVLNFFVQVSDSVFASVVPKMYNKVVVISKTTGKFLKAHGLQANTEVIYAGVDSVFSSKNKPIDIPLDIPKGYQVVTFLGRMIPSKNPRALVTAANQILKTNKKIVFIFAGDGSEYDRLKKSESENIYFLGKISKKSASALLQETTVFVHPSVHHEGLPISLLEAGMAGCAVLASNAGATQEIIIENVTGKIITDIQNIAPDIQQLLDDPALRKQLGNNLKLKVSTECNWPSSAKKYYSVLQNIK